MAAVYLLYRCGRTAIPASTNLRSIAKGSPGWELDSKTHAAQTQQHLSVLCKETSESRELPALLSHSYTCSLSASVPPAPLGSILPPPCTGRDVAMGLEEQRPFMKQFSMGWDPQPRSLFMGFQPRRRQQHLLSEQPDFAQSQDLLNVLDHLFYITYTAATLPKKKQGTSFPQPNFSLQLQLGGLSLPALGCVLL